MQKQKDVIESYNKAAGKYADHFIDELGKKHFDRMLLNSFAYENKNNGRVIDLGCGPGQTTRFLFDCGVKDITGTDISSEMIKKASEINPGIKFETADILNLKYPEESFGSAIAFYAIVHFDYGQLKTAFKEIKRILKKNGQFLFSFHAGTEVVHLDEFLDTKVNLDFYFFETSEVISILKETGFGIIDVVEREPHKDVEHPSIRAYVWVKKQGP